MNPLRYRWGWLVTRLSLVPTLFILLHLLGTHNNLTTFVVGYFIAGALINAASLIGRTVMVTLAVARPPCASTMA